MALQKREKILVGATGGLLLASVVYFLLPGGSGGSSGSLGQLRQQRDALASEVDEKKMDAKYAAKASDHLAEFERRALPTDRELARSLYLKWLRELAISRAKLHDAKVDPAEEQSRRGIYRKLRFTVLARGTLSELTEFLYGFYSADLLHKIVRLTAQPLENSEELSLVITIEALSLPEVTAKMLSAEPAKRLDLPKKEDYLRTVVRRKLEEAVDGRQDRYLDTGGLFAGFVPYRPPPPPVAPRNDPPPEPRPPGFDTTKHTYVTATLETSGKPEVWLNVRTTGEKLKLFEGDPFEIGEVTGSIVQIEPRFVVVEIEGQRFRVKLGDSLGQGTTQGEAAARPRGPSLFSGFSGG
ncbi:MAG: hypothetical protein JXB62_16270 [Pirellulales bacterium]|nr:hypothetical protein [Pirellulales bacterium]